MAIATRQSLDKLISYQFAPGRRSILAEIYFPQRLSAQGTIFTALEEGLKQKLVKAYLIENAAGIMKELDVYAHWFDPNRYGGRKKYRNKIIAAKARLAMCSQVFCGWSMNDVDGVFLKKNGRKIDEERTQVIRLIFRFQDETLEKSAAKRDYPDVYRAILYWVLSAYGHADDYESWREEECERFLNSHELWRDEDKRAFARELYPKLAKKISKWIADCGLFVFGYLVREFWRRIVKLNKEHRIGLEDEIWVSSIFHANINVMAPRPRRKRP